MKHILADTLNQRKLHGFEMIFRLLYYLEAMSLG